MPRVAVVKLCRPQVVKGWYCIAVHFHSTLKSVLRGVLDFRWRCSPSLPLQWWPGRFESQTPPIHTMHTKFRQHCNVNNTFLVVKFRWVMSCYDTMSLTWVSPASCTRYVGKLRLIAKAWSSSRWAMLDPCNTTFLALQRIDTNRFQSSVETHTVACGENSKWSWGNTIYKIIS